MSAAQTEATMPVTSGLREISGRLADAAAIAKAAVCCAESGAEGHALTIALDLEEPLGEANTLVNAVSLIQRTSEARERASGPPS
jgi:hypothetical protein